jgi:hypothetical protein
MINLQFDERKFFTGENAMSVEVGGGLSSAMASLAVVTEAAMALVIKSYIKSERAAISLLTSALRQNAKALIDGYNSQADEHKWQRAKNEVEVEAGNVMEDDDDNGDGEPAVMAVAVDMSTPESIAEGITDALSGKIPPAMMQKVIAQITRDVEGRK